ncbi:RIP metalloprotease RseP [Larkinella arboricola]|uniref:Zinc metalloprotease n=1 Tax=Larkinella arboricola TaxID=643671 RepID=A0A327X4N1_LARAB|nr:RIP metalloprotease RseP [Larkinella arboricola]RAJ97868.1 regulator of sigma E protease [Larkinella arboricola]
MEIAIMAGQLILGLSILVGLHELGHLLAAKAFGMRVEQYFIGFPPKIWSIKRGETEYGLGAIPLGGFVKITGMIDESLDTKTMQQEPQPWEFRSKPAWQRLIVMLGGIIINIITGIVIFVILTYKNGETYLAARDAEYGIVAYDLAKGIGLKTGDKIVKINGKDFNDFSDIRSSEVFLGSDSYYTVERKGPDGKIQQIDIDIPNDFLDKLSDKKNAGQFLEAAQPFRVGELVPGMPAEKSGLKKGDIITAVNGQPTRFYHEFQAIVKANVNKPITLTVNRPGASQPVTLKTTVTEKGQIGFGAETLLKKTHIDYTFGQALVKGTEQAFGVFYDTIKGFGKIFQGNVSASNALSGPIGIAQNLFGGIWEWNRFWFVTGLLSMSLAFFNVLPIPALDGGHSTILLYEIVSGRKPSDRFLEGAQRVGMVILLGLMAFAIFNDVFKAVF